MRGVTQERLEFETLAEMMQHLSRELDPQKTVLTAPNGQRYRGAKILTVKHPDGSQNHDIELIEEFDV